MANKHGFLQKLVTSMGIILLIGVLALFVAVLYKVTIKKQKNISVKNNKCQEQNITLPIKEEILSFSKDGENIYLLVRDKDLKQKIISYNICSDTITQEIKFGQ